MRMMIMKSFEWEKMIKHEKKSEGILCRYDVKDVEGIT